MNGPLTLDLLLAAVALLVFVVDLLMPAEEKRGLGVLACVGLAGVLGASFYLDASGSAFGGAFVGDALSLYLKRIFLAAGALAILASIQPVDAKLPRRQGEYYVLILLSLLGMSLLASARELLFLLVCFELMSLPLAILAALEKNRAGGEAGIKLYLVGAASTAITLYGLSLVYGAAGTTTIAGVAAAAAGPAHGSLLLSVGLLAVLAGLGFKIGAVPFHMWVPDTYEGAPTPFVGFLSVAPKVAGFAMLLRLYVDGFGPLRSTWGPVLILICTLTLVVGNILAIPQRNVKRLLAYSGVAQIGYMLLGLVVGTTDGLAMLLFYLTSYLFTSIGAFAVASAVADSAGSDDLAAYKGLWRRSPPLALAMLLFLLSLGGIPFVAGFWAKVGMLLAAWSGGLGSLSLLGAFLAVLGLFYYLKVARSIYLEQPDAGALPVPIGLSRATALVVACAGVVGMGIYPRPFVDAALVAAKTLIP